MKIRTSDDTLSYLRGRGVQQTQQAVRATLSHYDDYVFTAAGAPKLAALEALNKSLIAAAAHGEDYTAWRRRAEVEIKRANARSRQYLRERGRAKNIVPIPIGGGLPDSRLRLIHRVNMGRAQQAGHWARIQKNAGRQPWLMYNAINDERVRDGHLDLDGIIRRVEDPIWQTIAPPNGFNCRCSLIPLSDDDLKEEGLKPTRDGALKRLHPAQHVAEGWGSNPGENWRAQGVQMQADKLTRQLDMPWPPLRGGRQTAPQYAHRKTLEALTRQQLLRRAGAQAAAWRRLTAKPEIAAAVSEDWRRFVEHSAAATRHNAAARGITRRIVAALEETAQTMFTRGLVWLDDGDVKAFARLVRKDKMRRETLLTLPALLASKPDKTAILSPQIGAAAWKVEGQQRWIVAVRYAGQYYWYSPRGILPPTIYIRDKRSQKTIRKYRGIKWA